MASEYCSSAYVETENGRNIINCKFSGKTCALYSQEKAPPGCILYPKRSTKKIIKRKIAIDESQGLETKLAVKMPVKLPIREPQDSYA